MDDLFDEFVIYDAVVGADTIKCPKCGTSVDKSILFDDEVDCPGCGEKIK